MTQLSETSINETPQTTTISVNEMETALNAAFSPHVPDKIKLSLIAAMQTVLGEVEDD